MPSDSVNVKVEPEFYRFGDNHELCRFPSGSWSLRYLINGDPAHVRYLDEHEQQMIEAVRSSHPESREQGETKAVSAGKDSTVSSAGNVGIAGDGQQPIARSGLSPAGTAPSSARAELVESDDTVEMAIREAVRKLREAMRREAATALSAREGEIYEECAQIAKKRILEVDDGTDLDTIASIVVDCIRAAGQSK